MDTNQSLTIKFRDDSYQELMRLARQLNTTPVNVIEKALALLIKVQGKKIVLKEDHNPLMIEIDVYSHQPKTG